VFRVKFNVDFWEPFIRRVLLRQITAFVENLKNRVLPSFDNIEEEAQRFRETEWERVSQSPGSPSFDPASAAERVDEVALGYYLILVGTKQCLLNISATVLYHLFEQGTILFLRREILRPEKENKARALSFSVFKKLLAEEGIDITRFESWPLITELHLVANVAKHAEGRSSKELHTVRRDMFVHPTLRPEAFPLSPQSSHVYMPLAGEDLYVTLEDIEKYKNAVAMFWEEFINATHLK
jgi:hypothetical protein